ncbi:MAG TPA: M20 family metallopeptidase [Acidimicrobiales bacterium]|jgi:amidohydrolase|nr:M20 family metallopeptidase [Acidimicrobiales bacterium]
MDAKAIARQTLDGHAADLVGLSHQLHQDPELGFAEYHAAEALGKALEAGGFAVTRGVGDLPTAFVATAGEGDLRLAICAEYDALPDIGHACGHNVIAAAATGAALALAPVADELGLTVQVVGTPAEEGGGGKILLLEAGAFEGVHAAMMVHPSPREEAAPRTLAVAHLEVGYTGRAAHAAAYPEMGVNAADALTVAQVGVGLLRQHILPHQRIHGIVTKGGAAPNIVPAETAAAYYVRAATLAELAELEPRVRACFEAGATATGCGLSVEPVSPPYSEFTPDEALVAAYRRNAQAIGRPLPDVDRAQPHGSTDMANVSLALPAIQPMVSIDCDGSVNHQPEFARYCAEPSADQAALEGAAAMAWTAIDVAGDQEVRRRLLAGTRRPLAEASP